MTTAEDLWKCFRKSALPPDIGRLKHNCLRSTFYAGYATILTQLRTSAARGKEINLNLLDYLSEDLNCAVEEDMRNEK